MLAVALALPVWGAEPPGMGVTRLTPVAPAEQRGPIFPILEDDLRRTIQARFEAKIPELKEQFAKSIRRYRVPAFPRPTTDTARTVLVDPSLTLQNDVLGPQGQLIARAGTRVNPLHTIAMRQVYLVLDGSDERQLAWARQELHRQTRQLTTLFLTDGNLGAVKAAVPMGTPVYPAPAELFARFPVDTVPARLSRAEDQLRIDFIAEQELK
jgi:conjugal transfer pilus assembly protein TraW